MYVCIHLYILRFITETGQLSSSFQFEEGFHTELQGDRKDDFAALLIDARVGRAAGLVKTDFCYDRLMGRTNGCRCFQRGENRWGLWWSGLREHSSGRGNFFVTLLQLRIVVFWVGERNKGGEGGGKWEKGFPLLLFFSPPPTLVSFVLERWIFCKTWVDLFECTDFYCLSGTYTIDTYLSRSVYPGR